MGGAVAEYVLAAAQAAQKTRIERPELPAMLAAAQAAQKVHAVEQGVQRLLAAAQAAQKGCHRWPPTR